MKHLAAAAVALSFCVSGAAIAQTADSSRYPTRAIRIVVPFGPGGPSDLVARAAAQKMTEGMGQQIVIENRGGANGIVGTEASKPGRNETRLSRSVGRRSRACWIQDQDINAARAHQGI